MLVKILPMILSEEERNVYMTPPTSSALLLVNVLLVILNEEPDDVYMTPPAMALLLVKVP